MRRCDSSCRFRAYQFGSYAKKSAKLLLYVQLSASLFWINYKIITIQIPLPCCLISALSNLFAFRWFMNRNRRGRRCSCECEINKQTNWYKLVIQTRFFPFPSTFFNNLSSRFCAQLRLHKVRSFALSATRLLMEPCPYFLYLIRYLASYWKNQSIPAKTVFVLRLETVTIKFGFLSRLY